MPIWLELTVVMLVAYATGLGAGFLLWGRTSTETYGDKENGS